MYGDRYLEYLNNVQGERDGKFAAFETGIHYTEDLTAMIHVEQMWETSQNGQSPLHDPVRQSTLNAAEVVRRDLLDKLGSDLTVADDYNPFFHTGSRVKLSSGSARSYRPWEDIQNVADGRTAGKDRVTRETWNAHINRVIRDQLFPNH